jgi:hypothetical protein
LPYNSHRIPGVIAFIRLRLFDKDPSETRPESPPQAHIVLPRSNHHTCMHASMRYHNIPACEYASICAFMHACMHACISASIHPRYLQYHDTRDKGGPAQARPGKPSRVHLGPSASNMRDYVRLIAPIRTRSGNGVGPAGGTWLNAGLPLLTCLHTLNLRSTEATWTARA